MLKELSDLAHFEVRRDRRSKQAEECIPPDLSESCEVYMVCMTRALSAHHIKWTLSSLSISLHTLFENDHRQADLSLGVQGKF